MFLSNIVLVIDSVYQRWAHGVELDLLLSVRNMPAEIYNQCCVRLCVHESASIICTNSRLIHRSYSIVLCCVTRPEYLPGVHTSRHTIYYSHRPASACTLRIFKLSRNSSAKIVNRIDDRMCFFRVVGVVALP